MRLLLWLFIPVIFLQAAVNIDTVAAENNTSKQETQKLSTAELQHILSSEKFTIVESQEKIPATIKACFLAKVYPAKDNYQAGSAEVDRLYEQCWHNPGSSKLEFRFAALSREHCIICFATHVSNCFGPAKSQDFVTVFSLADRVPSLVWKAKAGSNSWGPISLFSLSDLKNQLNTGELYADPSPINM